MTRNPIGGPTGPKSAPPDRRPDDDEPRQAAPTSTASTARTAKAKQKPKPQVSRGRAPRAHGVGHKAPAGHAAGHHDDESAGAQAVAEIDAREGVDRRHTSEPERLEEQQDEVEEHDEAHESAATGADAVKRSRGGDGGGGDGFHGGRDQREAYERWMRGNVDADRGRIEQLKSRGARDDFDPARSPEHVEALGPTRAAAHLVRLHEAWALDAVPRGEAIERAARLLAGFGKAQNIRRVLAELESSPIRDVYPLEILMRMLDERPELLPGVRAGSVLTNADALADGAKVIAGYAAVVEVPRDVRLKSFALLGGARPGYEFHPAKDEGKYTLLIDTPGRWTFAVLAAPLQQLARIQRETNEAILELFPVHVHAMGKKGEPLTAEEWAALADDGDADEDEDADDPGRAAAGGTAAVTVAPNLAMQLRQALEEISRDDDGGAGATTYSWKLALRRPGDRIDAEPILVVRVEKASAFDAAWLRARDTIAAKQREYEPSRAVLTMDDITAALRRARVR